MLQGLFKVLRDDLKLWFAENIIVQSQSCVILHKMLVEIQKNGDFREDMEEKGQVFDVVSALLEEGQDCVHA